MKNTNSNEYKNALKDYLIPIIEDRADNMGKTITGNPFKFIFEVAKSECPEYFKQNEQDGMKHWLSGLGMGIVYTNYDIINLCEKLHECKLTEKQKDTVIENWFNHLAFKIIQFSR
jgi:hypothetical protein